MSSDIRDALMILISIDYKAFVHAKYSIRDWVFIIGLFHIHDIGTPIEMYFHISLKCLVKKIHLLTVLANFSYK